MHSSDYLIALFVDGSTQEKDVELQMLGMQRAEQALNASSQVLVISSLGEKIV